MRRRATAALTPQAACKQRPLSPAHPTPPRTTHTACPPSATRSGATAALTPQAACKQRPLSPVNLPPLPAQSTQHAHPLLRAAGPPRPRGPAPVAPAPVRVRQSLHGRRGAAARYLLAPGGRCCCVCVYELCMCLRVCVCWSECGTMCACVHVCMGRGVQATVDLCTSAQPSSSSNYAIPIPAHTAPRTIHAGHRPGHGARGGCLPQPPSLPQAIKRTQRHVPHTQAIGLGMVHGAAASPSPLLCPRQSNAHSATCHTCRPSAWG